MVRIKENLRDPKVELWYHKTNEDKGEYIGQICNALQFADVRRQIKFNKYWGYRIYYKGNLIKIDRNGSLENWPEGLYNQLSDILIDLV